MSTPATVLSEPKANTAPMTTPAKRGAGPKKPPARARGKKNKRSKEPLWRYTHGDHGHAVTVFQKRGKRNLYIEWWSPAKNDMERHSLGHSDQELARNQAKELSDQIRLRTQQLVGAGGEPRLDVLLRLYYDQRGKLLSGQQPAEHERRRRLWTGFFERQPRPIVYPRDLDQALFDTFVFVRRHGDLAVDGIMLPEPAPQPPHKGMKREAVVQDGTIDADLIYLNAALNWAMNYRVNGEPLLTSKPKVPRCKPQSGTLRQPVAAEDDLEALRPVLDQVDPQKLLRYWVELENQYGWRVTGLSSIKASDIDFTPQPHAPYGQLYKNAAIDKERRNDAVPLTKHVAALLRELLALRGLEAGDDAYLFPAPKGNGNKPWSRFHVGRLLVRAEKAAEITHIGGLHAWRRKWHTERKNYPTQDVAVAAGYADPRSVERYRHADPETTYLVVTTPTVQIRRTAQGEQRDAAAPREQTVGSAAAASKSPAPRRRKLRRRAQSDEKARAVTALAVGQGRGSAAKSVMPDGTVVASRDERFAANLAVARAYAAEHGHLLPKKHERPGGVDVAQEPGDPHLQRHHAARASDGARDDRGVARSRGPPRLPCRGGNIGVIREAKPRQPPRRLSDRRSTRQCHGPVDFTSAAAVESGRLSRHVDP